MAIVTVTGNLTKDTELKQNTQGSPFVSFGVADNINKDTVQYFNCTLWGSVAEKLQQYLNKGTKVTIIGRLQLVEGKGDYGPSMMVNVIDIQMMGAKPDSDNSPAEQSKENEEKVQFDDEIPF